MMIAFLAIIGLLIFCTIPFVYLKYTGYCSGLTYLWEGEGDLQYYVALCALIPMSIIILQFLKIKEAEKLTQILSYLSFFALLITLLNADGDLRKSSLLVGAPLLLFIDYAALAYMSTISIEKISMDKLLKGSAALSALVAVATFCTVPFFVPDWPHASGVTGLDMFDLMDRSNDFSSSFGIFSFILIPVVIATMQVNKNAYLRFFSTIAMWLPFLFFIIDFPEYGFTAGAYAYMFLSVTMSCIAYHLIGAEKNISASAEKTEQLNASTPIPSYKKVQIGIIMTVCGVLILAYLSGFLLQAFSIGNLTIIYILWTIYALIIIGCIIKAKDHLNIASKCGLGLLAVFYLSVILRLIYQSYLIKQQDYEGMTILPIIYNIEHGLLIIALLIFIWPMNVAKRIKYTFSILPILTAIEYFTTKFIEKYVQNLDSSIAFEDKNIVYNSLMTYSELAFFVLTTIIGVVVWRLSKVSPPKE